MPSADRQNRTDLKPSDMIDSLLSTPQAFEFISAMQLLRIAALEKAAKVNVGSESSGRCTDADPQEAFDGCPAAPVARFIANPSLAYPETELTSASPMAAEATSAHTIAMNFLGLHGPTGVLPMYVTQAVATAPDFAITQVLDFFNDRFAQNFARASEMAHTNLLARHALPMGPGNPHACDVDPMTRLLTEIAGAGHGAGGDVGPRSRRYELSITRYYAAAWRNRPMPLTSLQSMLRDLLQVPVRVLPFEPLWVNVDAPWRLRPRVKSQVAFDAATDPMNCEDPLTRNRASVRQSAWVVGGRTRQAQGGVLIRIGPLDRRTFCRLLPPRAPEEGARPVRKRLLWRLCTLIGAALGPWSDFVIQPVLARKDVHQWILRGHRKRVNHQVADRADGHRGDGHHAGENQASANRPGSNLSEEEKNAIPDAVLGRTMFLLRQPKSPDDRVYPFDTDFDKLKISSITVRRSAPGRRTSRKC